MYTVEPTSSQSTSRVFLASRQSQLFQPLKQMQFSGRLILTDAVKNKWIFYLFLGRLMYATGGIHPVRRWKRNISYYFPEMASKILTTQPKSISNSQNINWEYDLLYSLVEQQEINREQVTKMIQTTLIEMLFDISKSSNVEFKFYPEKMLLTPLVVIDPEQIIVETWKQWQKWQAAKLGDRSPNSAPSVIQPELLRLSTSEKTYQSMSKYLDGSRSLRELAMHLKQDLLPLTRSLIPYIQRRIIELVDIEDLPPQVTKAPPSKEKKKKPVIACIDDSLCLCQTMEKIITSAGYKFVGVTESLRAIASVLDHKPDLIFLDLIMPYTNGYEVCAQLRKIPLFENIPIIIVTGNDGIIDRLRAKIVGSSDFLTKPVNSEAVLSMINKHLKVFGL